MNPEAMSGIFDKLTEMYWQHFPVDIRGKKHWPVPYGFYYNFDKKVCMPLNEYCTTEQKLHQFVGVWIEE